MQKRWHNISVNSESYDQIKKIQKLIPIRASLSQTIDWLINVGQKQIKSELLNENRKQ